MSGTSSLATDGDGKIKHCIDASTDRAAMTGAMAGTACEQGAIVKTAAGYEMEATCKIGGMTSNSKPIVSGEFNSQVTVDVTSLIPTGSGSAKEPRRRSRPATWDPAKPVRSPATSSRPDGKVIRVPGGGR